MIEKIGFSTDGWDDYAYWLEQGQKRTTKKINDLIKSIKRTPFEGIGKPEALKHELTGRWSREIDQKNRLVYELIGESEVIIYQCRGHYDDK